MSIPSDHVDATSEQEVASTRTHTQRPRSSDSTPPAPSSSFCQAMVFFYACGCRSTEPVYCCQPPASSPATDSSSSKTNPCKHESPDVVVAKLPHACGRRIGKSEACGAEDPGTKEFVREVDTAERLDIAVMDGLEKDEIETALPSKVESEFTVKQVVSRSKSRSKSRTSLRSKKSVTFSATAAPFVPGLRAYTPASTPPPVESPDVKEDLAAAPDGVARVEQSEIEEEVSVNHVEISADGASGTEPSVVEATTDNVCADEAGQVSLEGEKSAHHQNDSVSAEEEFDEVALVDPNIYELDDLELPELTPERVSHDEWPRSSIPTAEPTTTIKNEEPQSGSGAPATDLKKSDESFDNLLKALASERRAETKRKTPRSCYSNVSTLIGSWFRSDRV